MTSLLTQSRSEIIDRLAPKLIVPRCPNGNHHYPHLYKGSPSQAEMIGQRSYYVREPNVLIVTLPMTASYIVQTNEWPPVRWGKDDSHPWTSRLLEVKNQGGGTSSYSSSHCSEGEGHKDQRCEPGPVRNLHKKEDHMKISTRNVWWVSVWNILMLYIPKAFPIVAFMPDTIPIYVYILVSATQHSNLCYNSMMFARGMKNHFAIKGQSNMEHIRFFRMMLSATSCASRLLRAAYMILIRRALYQFLHSAPSASKITITSYSTSHLSLMTSALEFMNSFVGSEASRIVGPFLGYPMYLTSGDMRTSQMGGHRRGRRVSMQRSSILLLITSPYFEW